MPAGEQDPEPVEDREGDRTGSAGSSDPDPGGDPADPIPEAEPGPEVEPGTQSRKRLSGWVEKRAKNVVSKIYESRVDDLEERARRLVAQAYRERADDIEERAVRALRRALAMESRRFKKAVEHAVAVKKREVRLSLLVLVAAAVIYLGLYWFTRGQG